MNGAPIHQVVVGAAPGDAVTSMALRMRSMLRERHHSELYGLHVEPALHGDVLPLSSLEPGAAADILVYHSSIGEPQVTDALTATRSRLVVCYHNITPSSFFEVDYPEFAELLRWGREELELIRPRVVAAFADSRFNADELVSMGYTDVQVAPAGLDPLRLTRCIGRTTLGQKCDDATNGWPYVIAIAQQLPHKRLDVVIEAVHLLQTVHRRELGLVIVGVDRFPRYGRALRALAHRLRVRGVWFSGSLADVDLAFVLRAAQVFVSASEHEGLGVPALEAMAFDVPVVARAIAAVPEVVGSAGVLLPRDAGPELFAEAIALLCDDGALRQELIVRGRQRVSEMSVDTPTRSLVAALEGLCV